MNPALWLLIGMQARGWARYFLRRLLTLKGALLAILGGTFLLLWLLSVASANAGGGGLSPASVQHSGPGVLLFYCFMNLILSSGDRGIYFTPAEINFLFPAPASRRSLLAYKIVASLIISLPSSLIMAAISYGFSTSFLTAFIGMLQIVLFMQLFTMALNLVAVTLGATLYSRGRKMIVAALVLLAALITWEVGGHPSEGRYADWLQAASNTRTWQMITLPLSWFFKTFAVRRLWPDLAMYATLTLLVNGLLLGVVFALDAQYTEAAAFASARVYARLQRMRAGTGGVTPPSTLRFALPMLPALGGIGTLCWRQLTTSVRMPSRLLYLCMIFVMVIVVAQAMNPESDSPLALAALTGIIVIVTSILLTPMISFDFRGDVDRLAFLKTLPFTPWRLALGQLLAPVLLVSLVQWLVLAVFFVWIVQDVGPPRGSSTGYPGAVLLLFALFAPAVNALLFAVENMLFLLFPTRVLANNPADFQAIGRNVLSMLAKAIVLGGVFTMAGMIGLMVGVFFPLLGLLLAWVTIVFFTAPLIPLIGWAFTIFDVSRDTPA